jgi:hypothetical protein
LLNRCSNGFLYFSQVLALHRDNPGLSVNTNMLGLIRNIGEVYLRWEMYEQAAGVYEVILGEREREGRREGKEEEAGLMRVLMACINRC